MKEKEQPVKERELELLPGMMEPEGTKKESPEKGARAEKKKGGWIREFLTVFLMAVLVALVVKTFLVDTRVVPSASMYPTIEIGDRVLVNKIGHLLGAEPQRGDIVVFKAPEEMNQNSDLIKRVIGLPGETLCVHDGVVYIDDAPLAEDYLNEAPNYDFGPVSIPEDCYFMLGDNRNRSVDAHLWSEPFIHIKDIKGKAFCRYWPLNRIGDLDE